MRRLLAPLTLTGLLLGATALTPTPSGAAGMEPPPVAARFGSTIPGNGNGEFDGPRGVAIAPNGDVFVADSGNNRIQRLSADGTFETAFGTVGSGAGELLNPFSVAIAADGDVLVADTGNSRVQRFSPNGAFLDQFGGPGGVALGTFGGLRAIAVGGSGKLYTVEASGPRIQVFDADGSNPIGFGSLGSGDGELMSPEGIGVSAGDDVYVADTGNHRVQQFTSTGTFVREWGELGTGDGQFDTPVAVAVDTDGDVWVTDQGNDRVQVFGPDGTFKFVVGGPGTQPGELTGPYGVAVRGAGEAAWVADTAANQLHWWSRPRTDARVKRGVAGPLAGNNVYNATGANQSRSGSTGAGGTVNYFVSVQNDVPQPEAFRLKGLGSTPRFAVRYFAGPTNVTGQVVAGTYTTPELAVGQTSTLRVQVTVKPTAPRGSTLIRPITARADSDPDRVDRVRTVTSRL